VTASAPKTLVSNTWRRAAASIVSSALATPMPALLISTSIRSCACSVPTASGKRESEFQTKP
jgi:hypothetical protein